MIARSEHPRPEQSRGCVKAALLGLALLGVCWAAGCRGKPAPQAEEITPEPPREEKLPAELGAGDRPGTETLLWFRIEYADATSQWIEGLRRDDFQTLREYQRHLALTENINHPSTPTPLHDFLLKKRGAAGMNHEPPIPIYPPALMAPPVQYSELPFPKKQLLSSCVRQVARAHPHKTHPETGIKNIKVYRVIHKIIEPKLLAKLFGEGVSPLHPAFYLPYYQGTFDMEGRLLARDGSLMTPTVEEIAKMSPEEQASKQLDVQRMHATQDSFLYWTIPIFLVDPRDRDPTIPIILVNPRDDPTNPIFLVQPPNRPPPNLQDMQVINYVKIHAGDVEM